MANLINMIPVQNPKNIGNGQSAPIQTYSRNVFSQLNNPYPQLKKYEYLPARPLSPARTIPKGSRPIVASGKIINENIFESAVSTVKAYKQYAVNLYDAAFKGQGNDYKVGKINDLSIRAGSLGIASILATSKFFPFAKGMEFIGFGTWFASMALWPRIIGAPIKALTGVNINQKYEDSEGRRKDVFEDNLYRPKDLFRHLDETGKLLDKDEYYKRYQYDYVYLEKLADKLGIPKEQKNRHEATMNKMGQIAVQGRAVSMLTAGVMTPVLSSVVADALQHPVKSAIESYRYNSTLNELMKYDRIMGGLLDLSKPFMERKKESNIEDVIKKLEIETSEELITEFNNIVEQKKIINREDFGKIKELFKRITEGTGLKESVEKYFEKEKELAEPLVSLNENLFKEIQKSTKEAVKTALSQMLPEYTETLPDNVKNYKGISENDFVSAIKSAFSQKGEGYASNIRNEKAVNLNVLETNSFVNMLKRNIGKIFKEMNIEEEAVDLIVNAVDKNIKNTIKNHEQYFIENNIDKLRLLIKFIEMNKTLEQAVKNFEKSTIMNISESMTASNWEKVPQIYLDAMGFSKQQITQLATMDASSASKIIAKKFEEIAADENLYEKTLKKMAKAANEAIIKEERAAQILLGNIDEAGVLGNIKDLMSEITKNNFNDSMQKSIETYYKNLRKDIIYKLRNTTDSFVRPIKALDTFKYLDKSIQKILGENADAYKQKLASKDGSYYMFHGMDYETAKESLKAFIKDIVLDKNDINNWTTKFEHNLPNGKKGMKYSLPMVQKIADIVYGFLNEGSMSVVDNLPSDKGTAIIVDELKKTPIKEHIHNKEYKEAAVTALNDVEELINKYWKKLIRFDKPEPNSYKFSQKCNINNAVMRSRFLGIEYKLSQKAGNHYFMRDYNPNSKLINKMVDGEYAKAYILDGLINEGREQLELKDLDLYKQLKNLLTQGKKDLIQNFKNSNINEAFLKKLDLYASSKEIAEMSGKNISDFFASAAQNYRSRNKWTKTAYGLLAGSIAVTALVISRIGKDNYFNTTKVVIANDNKKGEV